MEVIIIVFFVVVCLITFGLAVVSMVDNYRKDR